MATIYLRSTTGNDSNDGSSWDLAKATLGAAITALGAGGPGTIYVSQSHTESYTSTISYANSAVIYTVLCVSDASMPPTTLTTGATIGSTTGITWSSTNGTSIYMNGMSFFAGSGVTIGNLALNGTASMLLENCVFSLLNTSGTARIIFGGTAASNLKQTRLVNCGFKVLAPTNSIVGNGTVYIQGGYFVTGTVTPTNYIFSSSSGAGLSGHLNINGFDLSNLAPSLTIFGISTGTVGALSTIRNSRLPSSWTGGLLFGITTTTGTGVRHYMHNCDSIDTNYREWLEVYEGAIKSETTLVASGGASNGTTPISLKLASNISTVYPATALITDDIAIWNETIGSPLTVSLDILTDSATSLNNNEIWMDVSCVTTLDSTLGSVTTNRCDVPFGTPVAHATSSSTWTTTGMSTPNIQKLSVTVTPTQKGVITARVYLAKPSTTVYVDPKLTVA